MKVVHRTVESIQRAIWWRRSPASAVHVCTWRALGQVCNRREENNRQQQPTQPRRRHSALVRVFSVFYSCPPSVHHRLRHKHSLRAAVVRVSPPSASEACEHHFLFLQGPNPQTFMYIVPLKFPEFFLSQIMDVNWTTMLAPF